MATYLDRILDSHRAAARNDGRSVERLATEAAGMAPARSFTAALKAAVDGGDRLAVISEVKRRSPSKGDLAADLDAAALARSYAAGGAACLSVLTDEVYFGGSVADLQAVRGACALPVLRKDFTVSAADVCDARLMGADCVLLIAAALDDAELGSFHDLARDIGLEVLVEIHDEAELARAVSIGATLIGVNQRDLVTFEVDAARAARIAPQMPSGVVRVAESGIGGPADAARLAAAGYHAVLVGESLVTRGDPAASVKALRVDPAAG
ncbi:MAG: indole-3-glycerol phosphate synthase TrpC [Actinobacteria bacterium]|nr:indole-3-glycerol phosphate synthase TrpC [Actinomycetota bacterium]